MHVYLIFQRSYVFFPHVFQYKIRFDPRYTRYGAGCGFCAFCGPYAKRKGSRTYRHYAVFHVLVRKAVDDFSCNHLEIGINPLVRIKRYDVSCALLFRYAYQFVHDAGYARIQRHVYQLCAPVKRAQIPYFRAVLAGFEKPYHLMQAHLPHLCIVLACEQQRSHDPRSRHSVRMRFHLITEKHVRDAPERPLAQQPAQRFRAEVHGFAVRAAKLRFAVFKKRFKKLFLPYFLLHGGEETVIHGIYYLLPVVKRLLLHPDPGGRYLPCLHAHDFAVGPVFHGFFLKFYPAFRLLRYGALFFATRLDYGPGSLSRLIQYSRSHFLNSHFVAPNRILKAQKKKIYANICRATTRPNITRVSGMTVRISPLVKSCSFSAIAPTAAAPISFSA